MIKNTSIYTIGNILPKIAQFFLLPLFTRFLTPADYGIVNSLQVLISVLAIFFTLALERSIFRLFFDYKTDKQKKQFFGTIAISLFSISTFVLILLFLFNNVISQIYSSIDFYPYYVYAILIGYIHIFSLIPKIYFQVNEKATSFIIVSLLEFALIQGFMIWFVVFKGEGASGYLKGSLIASATLIPYFIYVVTKISLFRFDLKIFKDCISFSLPIIPSLMAAWVMNLSDRIFIEKYFNLHDVGIYSLGYKIGGLIIIFSQAFNKAYNPFYFRIANSLEPKIAKTKLYSYNSIYLVIILLAGFIISFFAKDLIYLLFDEKYFEAYKIIPIICLAFVVGQSTGLLNLSIYQDKKTKVIMVLFLISAIVNIILNFIMVPIWGAYGAAYATLITYLFLLITEYQVSKKYYFIPFNWKLILPTFSSIILIYFGFYYLIDFTPIINLTIKSIIIALILIIIYFKYSKKIIEIIRK